MSIKVTINQQPTPPKNKFPMLMIDPSVGQVEQVQNVRVYVNAGNNGFNNWIEIKLDHNKLEQQAEAACWEYIADSLSEEI